MTNYHNYEVPATEATDHESPDMVNHPPHYTQSGIECIDAIEAFCAEIDTRRKLSTSWYKFPYFGIVCLCHVLRYTWRHDLKNGAEDMAKAKWYWQRGVDRFGLRRMENMCSVLYDVLGNLSIYAPIGAIATIRGDKQ